MADNVVKIKEGMEDQELDRTGLTLINAVMEFKKEAEDARRTRLVKNRYNLDAYLGRQDYSEKIAGQSTEFLPKTPMAVEQLSAFVKKSLVQFGDWFKPDLGGAPEILTPEQIRKLVQRYLDNLPGDNNNVKRFATLMSDVIKSGTLESLMTVKVHGHNMSKRVFEVEPGTPTIDEETGEPTMGEDTLITKDTKVWRLRIDHIPSKHYLRDPSGNDLYEIHTVERDYHAVLSAAEAGVYDLDVVKQIKESYEIPDDEKLTDKERAQDETTPPSFRKKVKIDEFWGTLLGSDGEILHENIVCAIADDKYIIRAPEPNPFWHQKSPFISVPLIRVPHSVWHKALFDHASALNVAINELFNLMLDGAIAQVWGTKQIRIGHLEDPSQVSNGIPQGTTLAVKDTLPMNAKVLEQVTEGQVPGDAMAMFSLLQDEFTQSALTSELKMGAIPRKDVLATEVIEASQSQAITLDSIAADVENEFMSRVLELSWVNIMQNADDLDSKEVVAIIGPQAAVALTRMSKAQRYALFGDNVTFTVQGLTNTLTRARDFQKFMALLQAVSSNPMLMRAFFKRFSDEKSIDLLLKTLNINPSDLQRDENAETDMKTEFQELMAFMQVARGGSPQSPNTKPGNVPAGGDGGNQASQEVNQMINPLSGMTANG